MSVVLATGGAEEQLRQLPDGCAHACVTSPPYFGLRQYGGDGEIGLEQTPSDYIERLVRVFRETRRVLRDDGSCWIVIGDSYNNFRSQMGPGQAIHGREDLRGKTEPLSRKRGVNGLKEKDLIGIPWLLAFALRADGWYLREELPWLKPSCMPESVRDRCTRQHETIFRLTKSPQCYFDWYAIAENAQADHPSGNGFKRDARLSYKDKNGARGNDEQWTDVGGMRNARSVWQINPEPFDSQMCLGCGTYFRGADYKSLERDPDSRRICTCGAADRWLSHFAVFPTRLASRAIRATTPDGGCCGRCGAPFRRVLSEREADPEWLKACGADSSGGYAGASRDRAAEAGAQDASATKARILAGMRRRETAGWSRTCSCTDAAGIMPALVIDPFSGAGTTALCANRLGRDAYAIDLKGDYNRMAAHRLNDERAKCLDGDGTRLPFVPCEVYPA